MLLTLNDVAAVLNVSQSTIKRLVSSNALASVQVGASRRIQPQDLADFVSANRTSAAPATDNQG